MKRFRHPLEKYNLWLAAALAISMAAGSLSRQASHKVFTALPNFTHGK